MEDQPETAQAVVLAAVVAVVDNLRMDRLSRRRAEAEVAAEAEAEDVRPMDSQQEAVMEGPMVAAVAVATAPESHQVAVTAALMVEMAAAAGRKRSAPPV